MSVEQDLLAGLAETFAEVGLDHVLIGGHAVNVWAEPRFTADIDFTVVAGREVFADLQTRMEAQGWSLERQHGADLPSGPDFVRFVHPSFDAPVELQTAKTPFQLEVLRRASVHPACGGLKVASPEDLIVLKLIAFRAKDRGDLAALSERPDVEWDYVERWATEWEVADRLRQIRATS